MDTPSLPLYRGAERTPEAPPPAKRPPHRLRRVAPLWAWAVGSEKVEEGKGKKSN